MSPIKAPRPSAMASSMTRDQMLRMSHRRRSHLTACEVSQKASGCKFLYLRIYFYILRKTTDFSLTLQLGSLTPGRKRRALPITDTIAASVKSSPVPISTAEANESISMLIKLCPFFLKKLSGQEWIEIPISTSIYIRYTNKR